MVLSSYLISNVNGKSKKFNLENDLELRENIMSQEKLRMRKMEIKMIIFTNLCRERKKKKSKQLFC